jgi:hypothetical protein
MSKDELKEVLHIFQKDKSISPDGWSVEFYLGFYDPLGKYFFSVIEESQTTSIIHAPFNSTL